MNKLIEKAKKGRKYRARKITDEEMELAVAWAKDEVGTREVGRVLSIKHDTNPYTFLAMALRKYVKEL